MQQDRERERTAAEDTTDGVAARGDGAPHRSATQRREADGEPTERRSGESDRRAGASAEPVTRDYAERMRDLDRAGTVEEQGSGAGDARERRAAGGAVQDEPRSRVNSVRELAREHALTLGLAASSLALLMGARGSTAGGGSAAGEQLALDEAAFMPPAERAETEGVSWDLHLSEHERIDFFVEFLMGRNYDKTRLWLERIGKYGPMIQNELRERGMPQDLLYLAMIESGLDPTAYSKAHASGMWQFIKETGQRYGLEVSTYVDERRDPIKATAAGLTYLQQMHDRFDSWYLSAAGYNTGENRVGRLMRETTGAERGSDEGYWDIWDRLPRETRDYVPLMLAMGKIAKEPGKYGFHDLQYMEPLRFEEVVVPGGTKLSDVAAAAGVGADVIEDLNPHFLKKQTPPNRRVAVRVPVGQQQQVASALGGSVGAPVLAE